MKHPKFMLVYSLLNSSFCSYIRYYYTDFSEPLYLISMAIYTYHLADLIVLFITGGGIEYVLHHILCIFITEVYFQLTPDIIDEYYNLILVWAKMEYTTPVLSLSSLLYGTKWYVPLRGIFAIIFLTIRPYALVEALYVMLRDELYMIWVWLFWVAMVYLNFMWCKEIMNKILK